MYELVFFVPGKPLPQGSKKYLGTNQRTGRAVLRESSTGVYAWRDKIGYTARFNMRRIPLATGPVQLGFEFVMPRTKAMRHNTPPPMTQKPDLDKLARAVFDALTGIIYKDDSQVTDLAMLKRRAEHGEQTGVHITAKWVD
ncbi:RusA family crossover junction endodeoxyribonuclease [Corynebacterium phoceense]